MADAALEHALGDLIAHEAALLDAGRFDEWLALFAAEARYWVPLQGARQAEGAGHNSIADEDLLLLRLRVERLKSPRAHSQQPASACQHVLQQSRVVTGGRVEGAAEGAGAADGASAAADAAGDIELRTPFIYLEVRGDEQILLAGAYRHRLARIDGTWKIRLKRVDLLAPERPLPAIQLFI
jgi:3-phenylpropionate/cinnamic acid dioxygenase small subunit